MMRAFAVTMTMTVLVAAAWPAVAGAIERDRPPVKLTDEELARVTGKFILPNGVELALTVTSDTVVNGQLLLRTVLTVDRASALQVLARQPGSPAMPYAGTTAATSVAGPVAAGVTVSLDRQSGIQTITPTYAVGGQVVTVGTGSDAAAAPDLTVLALTPGGPAIATADGVVSLDAVRNGSRVTFASDQLGIVNLVGQSIATAVVNSADNRTIDTVTNVTIDARNIAPYQAGMAQMRVDNLAIDVARRIVR